MRADKALWRAELILRSTSKWVLRNAAHKTLGGGAAMHRVARTGLRPPFSIQIPFGGKAKSFSVCK